jgi:hypothetical protein
MPGGCRQARAQGVELIMQPLLSDAAIVDQAATITHRRAQRIDPGLVDMQPTRTLASKICQSRAIAIIGLESA